MEVDDGVVTDYVMNSALAAAALTADENSKLLEQVPPPIAGADMSADPVAQQAASMVMEAAGSTSLSVLCASISATARGLEVPSAAWQSWLPDVMLREGTVAKLGLRFEVQQHGGGVLLLPAEGHVVVRALKSADGIIR
jgi:hypothetical protein